MCDVGMALGRNLREMTTRKLPNEKNLKRLPLWAIVAFATRCALRVRPQWLPSVLSNLYGSPPSKEEISCVESLLDLSVSAASNATISLRKAWKARALGQKTAQSYFEDMIRRGHDNHQAPHDFDAWFDSHADRGSEFRTSTETAIAALDSALAAGASDEATTVEAAMRAIRKAESVYQCWNRESLRPLLMNAIQKDFMLLVERAGRNEWNDQTPVDRSFFDLPSRFE